MDYQICDPNGKSIDLNIIINRKIMNNRRGYPTPATSYYENGQISRQVW